MARSGFVNVSALHGGLDEWKKKGLPLEKGEPPKL
jgi:3-mercaptopyruvate sulfurtransferase SseA